ncbi:hypothetical protein HZC53_02090 [Candidatus Uhrbacteria bacterium]|nr:hypothetical protein [Candidatus Uhrbacteria bacterium]
MSDSRQGRVLMVDKKGNCTFYRRLSGPLQAGGIVLRIEALQTEERLDDEQMAILEREVSVFLATLKNGSATDLSDEFIAVRLLEQTADQAFNRLLKVRDAYASWMILAWTAEAKHLLGHLPADDARRPAVVGLLKRLEGWSSALHFDAESPPGPSHNVDWKHMAIHARRQADIVPRTEVLSDSSKSLRVRGQVWPLFAKLRALAKADRRIFLVGAHEDVELIESCRQAVGPVVEWLSCIPNDSYQSAIRLRLKHGSAAGALFMPDIDPSLARDLTKFGQELKLACAAVASPDGESLQIALLQLENDLKIS